MTPLLDLTPVSSMSHPAVPKPRRAHWKWALVAAGTVGLAAAGYVAAGQLKTPDSTGVVTPSSTPVEPPAVKTVSPVRQTVRRTVEQPGHVEGYEQTPLFVKIPGYVKAWKADIGDRVAAGQVLAELSVPEEQEELSRRKASATLAAAESAAAVRALAVAAADVTRSAALARQAEAAQTRAEASFARWSNEYARATSLKTALSASDFDATQDQYRTAEAALAESKAAVDSARAVKVTSEATRLKAEADVAVAESKQVVAAADVRKQAAVLTYASVPAPFNGLVAQRNVDNGQFVMPPASGAASPPLFVVVRTDPVRVFVDVPETDAAQVTVGLAATVRLPALGDREMSGTVSRFSWALDATTRTLRVQIDLPNPAGELRPGMYATAKLVLERPGAWVVPAGVVVTSDEQPFAVRLEGDKAFRTPVKLGGRFGTTFELMQKLTKPAKAGEPVLWEPLTGTEELLPARPPGWTDGMAVTEGR